MLVNDDAVAQLARRQLHPQTKLYESISIPSRPPCPQVYLPPLVLVSSFCDDDTVVELGELPDFYNLHACLVQ